jgi:hypothetical protein
VELGIRRPAKPTLDQRAAFVRQYDRDIEYFVSESLGNDGWHTDEGYGLDELRREGRVVERREGADMVLESVTLWQERMRFEESA